MDLSQQRSLTRWPLSGFFKYVSLGEATGAKVQANKNLLEVLKGEDFLSDDQNKYIDECLFNQYLTPKEIKKASFNNLTYKQSLNIYLKKRMNSFGY